MTEDPRIVILASFRPDNAREGPGEWARMQLAKLDDVDPLRSVRKESLHTGGPFASDTFNRANAARDAALAEDANDHIGALGTAFEVVRRETRGRRCGRPCAHKRDSRMRSFVGIAAFWAFHPP